MLPNYYETKKPTHFTWIRKGDTKTPGKKSSYLFNTYTFITYILRMILILALKDAHVIFDYYPLLEDLVDRNLKGTFLS